MAIDDNQIAREAVLARVRAALGRHGPDDDARAVAHAYVAERRQGPRPARPANLVQRFLDRAADMSSTTERVRSVDDVAAAVSRYVDCIRTQGVTVAPADTPVREQADVADAARLVATSGPARSGDDGATVTTTEGVRQHAVCWPEFASLRWRDAGIDVESRPTLGDDALGITGCFCAIAETGTLVFTSAVDTPTAAFLLPETHVAIVRADQIVAGMEDAFARVRAEHDAMPRAVNLVSGPSRTGDIEQTIVLGAHGPRRVHIIVVEG